MSNAPSNEQTVYTRIAGTGSCIASKLVTNDDISKMVETNHDWIVERSGIHQRYVLAEGESLTGLAKVAAERAMDAAGVGKADIDMIILATTTPDRTFPSNAVLLQHELGIEDCPAFDVYAACAGFNYGLCIADSFMKTGQAKCILLLGAEALSRITNWQDRSSCFLFGDGVGAVVLQQSKESGIIAAKMHAAGQYKDLLYAGSGLNHKTEPPHIVMQGNAVFKVAVHKLCDAVVEILESSGMHESQVDWLVPHQANLRIINAVAKRLNLPMERVVINIEKYGNTSSASVPIALDEAVRDGRIKRGEVLLLESFGGGFTWGSALIRY